MRKKSKTSRQSSQYDKIIKENLEATLPMIIADVLGLQIVASEELPDDIQHTKERKPDALKRVTDAAGATYLLHIEFQVEDEPNMVYRMAEYKVMLMRRYKLPVRQYVIFLRDSVPAMATYIEDDRFVFSYNLLRIAQTDYRLFLKQAGAEINMLAILADFGQDGASKAICSIVEGIRLSESGDFANSRYFNQLRIFVQLRNSIQTQFEQIMETVTKFFKEENDFLFRKGETTGLEKGLEKGIEKKSYEVVHNAIVKMGMTDRQAADIAGVSLDFVKKVRESLSKK